jgi:hypothetical protein
MAHHNNYWSCSKFADWLRGTAKPKAATSEGWDEWEENAKTLHPYRFWLADEGLGHLQDFVTWPVRKIYDFKYYINNRYVTRTHALTAHPRDIKPGDWCDVGNRFLPCLFNELVDFVEVELAWWHIAWSAKEEVAKYNAPFWAKGWFRWRTWRCVQAGLDNLEWQRSLVWTADELGQDHKDIGKKTQQAIKAQEILDLYTWWTTVYRNRPDPHDASGWSEYCEASRLANGGKLSFSQDKTPDLKKMSDIALKKLRKMEADFEKEDEQMMIRLIKVRHGLWT